MKFERKVWIDAPIEAVWAHVIDLERAPEYVPMLVDAAPMGDGEPQVGAKARLTFRQAGQEVTTTAEVTDYTPPRTLAVEAEVPGLDVKFDVRWTLAAERGGTTVHERLALDFHSFMTKMGAKAMLGGGKAEQLLDEGLAQLKQTVEREAAG